MKRKYSENSVSSKDLSQTKRAKLTQDNLIEKTMQEDIPGFRYIRSKYDQLDDFRIGPVNVLSSNHVKGLFATVDLPSDKIIGRYSGKRYDGNDAKVFDVETGEWVDPYDYHYTFSLEVKGSQVHIDGSKTGGSMIYINHSMQNNCIYDLPKKSEIIKDYAENDDPFVVVVRTIKPVKKGEQLLALYTHDYTCDGQVFLNKNDTDQSAKQYYMQHKKAYSLMNLYNDEALFLVPNVFLQLLNNFKFNESELNLSILPYDLDKRTPCEFSESDRISLLMLACEKGNYPIVKQLVDEDVDINLQQNHSGNCALNFAIKGYRTAIEKEPHTDIIIYIIKSGADLEIQNAEKLTFLHEAMRYLNPSSFERVLQAVPKRMFSRLIKCVDNNKDDFIKYGLRHEKLHNFQEALIFFSKYTFFVTDSKSEKRADITPFELANIVQNYTPHKFEELCCILEEKKYHKSGIEKLKYHFNNFQTDKLPKKDVNHAEHNPNYIDHTLWGKKKSGNGAKMTANEAWKRTQSEKSESSSNIIV